MTKIIKEVTLKEIKELQEKKEEIVDLPTLTVSLQARIIINISVGMGHSKTLIDFEKDDGTFEKISL